MRVSTQQKMAELKTFIAAEADPTRRASLEQVYHDLDSKLEKFSLDKAIGGMLKVANRINPTRTIVAGAVALGAGYVGLQQIFGNNVVGGPGVIGTLGTEMPAELRNLDAAGLGSNYGMKGFVIATNIGEAAVELSTAALCAIVGYLAFDNWQEQTFSKADKAA